MSVTVDYDGVSVGFQVTEPMTITFSGDGNEDLTIESKRYPMSFMRAIERLLSSRLGSHQFVLGGLLGNASMTSFDPDDIHIGVGITLVNLGVVTTFKVEIEELHRTLHAMAMFWCE